MLRPNVALQFPIGNAIQEEKKIPKDIFVKNETKQKKVNREKSSGY